MTLSELHFDNGFKSRKLLIVLFSQILVTAIAFMACKIPELGPIFNTFCGTIVSLAALYIGGNSALKYITGKNLAPEIPGKDAPTKQES